MELKRENEGKTPHNPNYYLIINEFKAGAWERIIFSPFIRRCCFNVELTFNVYIFYGGGNEDEKIIISRSNGIFMRPW